MCFTKNLVNRFRTKVWGCSIGLMHWGSSITIDRFESSDFTTRSLSVFGEVFVSNAVFTCRTGAVLGTGMVYRGNPTGLFYQSSLAEFQVSVGILLLRASLFHSLSDCTAVVRHGPISHSRKCNSAGVLIRACVVLHAYCDKNILSYTSSIS